MKMETLPAFITYQIIEIVNTANSLVVVIRNNISNTHYASW